MKARSNRVPRAVTHCERRAQSTAEPDGTGEVRPRRGIRDGESRRRSPEPVTDGLTSGFLIPAATAPQGTGHGLDPWGCSRPPLPRVKGAVPASLRDQPAIAGRPLTRSATSALLRVSRPCPQSRGGRGTGPPQQKLTPRSPESAFVAICSNGTAGRGRETPAGAASGGNLRASRALRDLGHPSDKWSVHAR